MTIPLFNSLYEDNEKKITTKKLNFSIINNLDFKKVDLIKFPIVKILNKLPNNHSLFETVIVSANDTLVNMFINKKISFLNISDYLLKIIEKPEFNKYKRISPKNIKDIAKLSEYISFKTSSLDI